MISIARAYSSGKSTLLHIAGLLDSTNSGSIYINNIPKYKINNLKYSVQIRLENLGFIYQNYHLLNNFTAQENVVIPLLISGIKNL